mgnify:CR=1 FL=1
MKSSRSRKTATPSSAASAAPLAPARKRLLVVDDHPFMRAGLAQLIDRQPDMHVCCEAGNPVEALQALARSLPDLVLTDITMPGRSGVEFVKDMLALYPSLPVLVISMHDESIYAERMLRAGARGYIMKEAGGEALLAALRQVLAGQIYVSAKLSARLLENLSAGRPRGSSSPIAKLTDREFEIFQLIGHGKSTHDIAAQLGLSTKTVDVHRANIKGKLGLPDMTALVRHAVRWLETGGAE